VSPLVFGECAKNYFNEMITFGRRLHRHLTSDQVLEYFDQKLMWNTLVKMTTFDKTARSFREFDPNCYDPRFVLRILVQLVAPGTRVTRRETPDNDVSKPPIIVELQEYGHLQCPLLLPRLHQLL
jgi:hypothetical protein